VVGDIFNITAVVLGFLTLVWLLWTVVRPDHQRAEEDAARDFFDRHGHWPDEPDAG